MRRTRPRLDPALYVGVQRYFLTFCTNRRRPSFANGSVVKIVHEQILLCAELFGFEVIAYCYMPNHLHLLIEGTADDADALAFVHQAKQRSGYACRAIGASPFWQPSFYDHIPRNEEATLSITRYILENPVRAGLVASPEEYPFSGSSRFGITEIMETACWQP
jgi:REP-associated tyrosine transposase